MALCIIPSQPSLVSSGEPIYTYTIHRRRRPATIRLSVMTSQTIPQILDCCGDRFGECSLHRNI